MLGTYKWYLFQSFQQFIFLRNPSDRELMVFYSYFYFLIFTNQEPSDLFFPCLFPCIFWEMPFIIFFSWKSVYLDWMLEFVSDVQFRSHIQKVKSDKCSRFFAFHFISRSHEFSSCPLELTFPATSYQYSQNTAHPARLLLSRAPEIISITCITKSVILCLNFLRYLSLCAK